MSESLIVFIHGLGANRMEWWGNSLHALYGSDRLRDLGKVHFFGYHSPKYVAGRPWRSIGIGRTTESVDDIALRLVTDIRSILVRRPHVGVVLVGHSLGGLVALNATIEMARSTIPLFSGMARPPVLIASPIAGSRLAFPVSFLPGNVHHKYMTRRSKKRAALLDAYANEARNRPYLTPIILGAAADAAVRGPERWFDPEQLPVPDQNMRLLDGGHSEVVQDLEQKLPNLQTIEDAVTDSYRMMPLAPPAQGVVVNEADWNL